jgi:hypothetical protein
MSSILNTPHWVYVVGNMDFGWVKIGFTSDMPRRMSGLRSGVPFNIERLASWKVPNLSEALKLEKMAHLRVFGKRIRGEWYGLSIEEIVNLAEYITGRTA